MKGISALTTLRFAPSEVGTLVIGLCGRVEGPLLKRKIFEAFMKTKGSKDIRAGLDRLHARILEDLAAGVSIKNEPAVVAPEGVSAAAAARLAG